MPRRRNKKAGDGTVAETTPSAMPSKEVDIAAPIASSRSPRPSKPSGVRSSRPGASAKVSGASSTYVVTNPGRLELPHPLLSGFDGTKLPGTVYKDVFATGRVQLFGTVERSAAQPSGVAGGGTAIPGDQLFNNWQARLGDQIAALAASKGLNITGYNNTTTFNTTIQALVGDLADAFRLVYGLRCLTRLYGFNESCSAVAAAVNQRLTELDARVNRLRAFFMPRAWCDALRKVTGVWITGRDSDAPYFSFFCGVTAAQMDLSLIANIDFILTAFDTVMTAIGALPQADVANYMRIAAPLYEPIDVGEGAVVNNEQEYCMMLSKGIVHADATVFTAPAMTGITSTPLVPLWVYGNPETLDPQWSTLMRPVICASDTGVAPAAYHWIGMFDTEKGTASTQGSDFIRFVTGVTFQNISTTELVSAGAKVVTGGTGIAFDAPWTVIAMREVAGAGQLLNANDNRSMNGWSLYYLPVSYIAQNTIVMWHNMFGL